MRGAVEAVLKRDASNAGVAVAHVAQLRISQLQPLFQHVARELVAALAKQLVQVALGHAQVLRAQRRRQLAVAQVGLNEGGELLPAPGVAARRGGLRLLAGISRAQQQGQRLFQRQVSGGRSGHGRVQQVVGELADQLPELGQAWHLARLAAGSRHMAQAVLRQAQHDQARRLLETHLRRLPGAAVSDVARAEAQRHAVLLKQAGAVQHDVHQQVAGAGLRLARAVPHFLRSQLQISERAAAGQLRGFNPARLEAAYHQHVARAGHLRQ